MKNLKIINIFLLALLLIPSVTFSSGGFTGKVDIITVKETGYIIVRLQEPHANPDACLEDKHIVVPYNHLGRKEILSLFTTAKVTDAPLSGWLTGCYENYGTSYPIVISIGVQ